MSTPASTVPELASASAGELARRIAAKEVTSREVVEALLARIEAVNPTVNAIRVVLADEALAAADEADAAVSAGGDTGPLHGVPFTVKENVDVAGSATTGGLSALVEAHATRDAPSTAGLRAAGGIPIGRTNMAESGLRWHSASDAGGQTINPWNAAVTPGGSSGGDAVALATGMTPLGIGNDLGGSLRVPPQFTGTVGLKPTFGRVAHATTVPPLDGPLMIQLMSVNGPLARRVADLRLALGPMSAPDARDPWQVPAPLEGPPAPRRAVVTLWDGVHPDVADGIRRAADALASAGWEVEDGEPPRLDEALDLWRSIVVSEIRAIWPMLEPMSSDDQGRFVDLIFEAVPALDPMAHGMAYAERQALAREWGEWMTETPLVLAPVVAHPPFEVGYDLSGVEAVQELTERMRTNVPANLLGLPAVAFPTGEANGLPQGAQVIGPRFREDLCLDAAEAVESALGTLTPIDPPVTEPRTPEEAAAAAVARAREREAAGDYADAARLEALSDDRPALDRLSEWAVIEVSTKNVRSTRRVGAPVTRFKRFLVRMLRQYNNEEQAQVTRFNVHVLGYVTMLEERVEELERRLRDTRG